MSHRRVDALFLAIVLATVAVAYFASTRPVDEPVGEPIREVAIPDLRSEIDLPPVSLPEPFFVTRRSADGRDPALLRPGGSDPMESALAEVRSALLASSSRPAVTYPE